MPKACVFCGGSPLTKEHVWPAWARDMVRSGAHEAPYWKERLPPDGGPVPAARFRAGEDQEPGAEHFAVPLYDWTVKAVCAACNNGWMAQLEVEAQPMFEAMLRGRGRVLREGSQAILAAWAVKTALMVDLVGAGRPIYGVDDYERFAKERMPAASTQIWMTAYAGKMIAAGLKNGFMVPKTGQVLMAVATITFGPAVFQVVDSRITGSIELDEGTPITRIWPFTRDFTWTPSPALTEYGLHEYATSLTASVRRQVSRDGSNPDTWWRPQIGDGPKPEYAGSHRPLGG